MQMPRSWITLSNRNIERQVPMSRHRTAFALRQAAPDAVHPPYPQGPVEALFRDRATAAYSLGLVCLFKRQAPGSYGEEQIRVYA